jgi:hypothetical protein
MGRGGMASVRRAKRRDREALGSSDLKAKVKWAYGVMTAIWRR